jgi:hypothetical protein
MRFSIRDILWLMVVVALALAWFVTAHRSALIEARLQAADRRIEDLKAEIQVATNESKNLLSQLESFFGAFKKLELSDEQRQSFGTLLQEELKQHGIPVVIRVD